MKDPARGHKIETPFEKQAKNTISSTHIYRYNTQVIIIQHTPGVECFGAFYYSLNRV